MTETTTISSAGWNDLLLAQGMVVSVTWPQPAPLNRRDDAIFGTHIREAIGVLLKRESP